MALTPGTTLGTYQILGSLGAGGMGEVYRARDTKLGRSVAIKVLPSEFVADPDRVPRFEREAKVLASLNHPHIAALYGMEHNAGQPPIHFLIMELVEGETLAERLERGPVPVNEALAIAIQIADALESAHEQGVVHRDLKPANIKITPEDRVKVLDFGLAKAMDSSPAASSPANSPTLSVLATQAGMIMGTAAYMSPEQAKGAATDRRSDVFSFGVVLYELLTARQPFQGDTAAEIMASVIIREADLGALPAGLNSRLAELIRRCLEKNPKKRWQAMGDLRLEIEAIAVAPHQATAPVPGAAAATTPMWRRAMPIVAAIALTAVASTFATRWLTAPPPGDVIRFAIPTPGIIMGFESLAWSPDGKSIVYVAGIGPGLRRLMLRTIGDAEARPIAGTDGQVSSPTFSPDGRFVAFYSGVDGALKKIAISGGQAVTLCPMTAPYSGPHWGRRGILIGQPNGGLLVSADGGEPAVVVPVQGSERISSPQFIDEQGSILFSLTAEGFGAGWENAKVIVQNPDGTRRVVITGGSDAQYLTSGHLLYVSGASLLAVPFDAASRQVIGSPVRVVEGVARGTSQLFAGHYAVSPSGSLAYVPRSEAAVMSRRTLALVDMTGKTVPLALPPNTYSHPRISPDGLRVAVATEDSKEAAIWIYELSGRTPARRLTFEGRNVAPIWTRDGQSVTFLSDRDGKPGLFRQPADGGGAAERLTTAEPAVGHQPGSWSPDGNTLSFQVLSNVSSIWTWSRGGDRIPQRLVHGARSFATSEYSPDGRWLAYGSNELDGIAYQVFVQPLPPTGAKYQVTSRTSSAPVWSHDGKKLYFAFSNQIYGVDVQTAPVFSASQAVEFAMPRIVPSDPATRMFDLMPNGKQFLVVIPEGSGNVDSRVTPQIDVVLNWSNELKVKAPIP